MNGHERFINREGREFSGLLFLGLPLMRHHLMGNIVAVHA
jgi:hypothetical protein